jgi:hypothetical protein
MFCYGRKTSMYKLVRSRYGPMTKKNPYIYWRPHPVLQHKASQFSDRTILMWAITNTQFLLFLASKEFSGRGLGPGICTENLFPTYLWNESALVRCLMNPNAFNSHNLSECKQNFGIMKLVLQCTYVFDCLSVKKSDFHNSNFGVGGIRSREPVLLMRRFKSH